jgi:UDP-glucose 4-epimerase
LSLAMRGQDVVYHFAGLASVRGTSDRKTPIEANVLATYNVLEAMRLTDVRHIVFASSSAVYGNTTMFPTPEDCPLPLQTSVYGACKLAAEGLISAYAREHAWRKTIFRFAPVLGERYRRGHLWDFWNKLKQDPACIEVLGDGQQRRSYVYVGDAIEAVVRAVDAYAEHRIFNVGNNYSITVDQSLDYLCEATGLNPTRTYTGNSWVGDKPLTILDCSRLRALGWRPKVSIKEAVLRTVESF